MEKKSIDYKYSRDEQMHRINSEKSRVKYWNWVTIILSIDKTTTEGYVCMRVYLTTDTGLSTTTFSVILFENN